MLVQLSVVSRHKTLPHEHFHIIPHLYWWLTVPLPVWSNLIPPCKSIFRKLSDCEFYLFFNRSNGGCRRCSPSSSPTQSKPRDHCGPWTQESSIWFFQGCHPPSDYPNDLAHIASYRDYPHHNHLPNIHLSYRSVFAVVVLVVNAKRLGFFVPLAPFVHVPLSSLLSYPPSLALKPLIAPLWLPAWNVVLPVALVRHVPRHYCFLT